jgi:hypothetical protein
MKDRDHDKILIDFDRLRAFEKSDHTFKITAEKLL